MENIEDTLADLGIEIVRGKTGWTAVRGGTDDRGPFEEYIGRDYPTYSEAVRAALEVK